jgi:hypothetical protein
MISKDAPELTMTVPDASQSDSSADNETNVPRLPTEILEHIFKLVDSGTPSPLIPVLRVNQMCYELVKPLLDNKTIHLNRESLPVITDTYQGWHANEKKRQAFTKLTRLVIDDIQVLFDRTFDKDLKLFCENVKLPNVTRIIFCQPEALPLTFESGNTHNIQHHSRAAMFARVLPARVKDVCIQIPKNGLFRGLGKASFFRDKWRSESRHHGNVLTSTRVMDYIDCFSGKITIRIHQPVSERYITLSDIGRATTIYSFYPDSSPRPGKDRIYQAVDQWMERHIWGVMEIGYQQLGSRHGIFGALKEILEGGAEPEEMIVAAGRATDPMYRQWVDVGEIFKYSLKIHLMQCFMGLMGTLNPDTESPCPCCGETGSPLKR